MLGRVLLTVRTGRNRFTMFASCCIVRASSSCYSAQFQSVDTGLKDAHPYVREAAVMGVLKCYHMDPDTVKRLALLDRVRSMLMSDPDPQVVANCLYVLQQVKDASSLR